VSGDAKPSYSPGGKRIAYSDYDGQDYEIYTINVGGGTPFQVTNNVKDEEASSYSPDGKKIAYECYKALGSDDDEDFDHEICTINVGGGGKTKVTDTVGYASDPSWGRRP
jgi:TolB protein